MEPPQGAPKHTKLYFSVSVYANVISPTSQWEKCIKFKISGLCWYYLYWRDPIWVRAALTASLCCLTISFSMLFFLLVGRVFMISASTGSSPTCLMVDFVVGEAWRWLGEPTFLCGALCQAFYGSEMPGVWGGAAASRECGCGHFQCGPSWLSRPSLCWGGMRGRG